MSDALSDIARGRYFAGEPRGDPTLGGIKNPALRLRKLEERKKHIDEQIQELEDKRYVIDEEIKELRK